MHRQIRLRGFSKKLILVSAMQAARKAAEVSGLMLKTDLPSTGPVIRVNACQIHQVLTHLIANAWEASKENQGTIFLAVKTVSQSNIPAFKRFPIDWQPQEIDFACLEVADEGHGIPD